MKINGRRIEKLTTTSPLGDELTAEIAYPADGQPVAYALFSHCFDSHGRRNAANAIMRSLTNMGLGVVHFDFAAHEHGDNGSESAIRTVGPDDVLAVARFMAQELGEPTLLVGHSLAGAAAVCSASEIPNLKAVATIGAPFGLQHLKSLLTDSSNQDHYRVAFPDGRTVALSEDFVDDLEAGNVEASAASLSVPILIMHASEDELVEVGNSTDLFRAAVQPKSFLVLDGTDHFLSEVDDARYAGSLLGTWFEKYRDTGMQEAKYIKPDDNRIYTRTGSSGYLTEIMANGHPLVSDEPKPMGGTDAGPSPYDYVAAALGACTGMTLRMYADLKDWPLLGVTVRLTHEKIHARDCETCETEDGNIDHIDREISLEGPLSEEQRDRLIEIANRCPVHRTLTEVVQVRTRELTAP